MLVTCLGRMSFHHGGVSSSTDLSTCSAIIAPGSRQSREINTLGYPKAALFAFCVALVAYNVQSTIKAALRSVHGEEKVEQEVSGYYVADEIQMTRRGMMIAIPEDEWVVFHDLSPVELADVLVSLAGRFLCRNLVSTPAVRRSRCPRRRVGRRSNMSPPRSS